MFKQITLVTWITFCVQIVCVFPLSVIEEGLIKKKDEESRVLGWRI